MKRSSSNDASVQKKNLLTTTKSAPSKIVSGDKLKNQETPTEECVLESNPLEQSILFDYVQSPIKGRIHQKKSKHPTEECMLDSNPLEQSRLFDEIQSPLKNDLHKSKHLSPAKASSQNDDLDSSKFDEVNEDPNASILNVS